jgi:hypothetical protein
LLQNLYEAIEGYLSVDLKSLEIQSNAKVLEMATYQVYHYYRITTKLKNRISDN